MFNSFFRPCQFISVLTFFILFFVFIQANPSDAKDVRIGVIDIQKAVSNTKEWKKEFSSFKIKFEKEKKSIIAKEGQLKKKIQDFGKQSMLINPALKKTKEDELLKKKREFERYVQDKNEDFAKQEKEITGKILKKMVLIIKNIGKSKNFTMVLEKKMSIYFDESLDLTSLATRTYDKKK
jgi:outer membrane protein